MPDRLVGPVRVDRVRVLAAGERRQMGPARLAEPAHDGVEWQCGQIADRPHAQVVQPLGRGRADAPQRLHVVTVEELELVGRLDQVDPGARHEPRPACPRLGGPRRQLGDHLRAPDPDRTLEMQVVVHPPPEALRDVGRRPQQSHGARHVDERLVEADRLHYRSDVGQDLVQLPAHLGVAAVAAGQEDRLGAELAGPHGRHSRVDPVDPGLVGARGHDAPGPGAADDHGLAGQGGIVEHLDRREERVHVDVQDGGGKSSLSHRGSTGGTPRRRRCRPSGPPRPPDGAPPRPPSRPGRRTESGGTPRRRPWSRRCR